MAADEGPENDLLAEGNPFEEEEKERDAGEDKPEENEEALLQESEEAEEDDESTEEVSPPADQGQQEEEAIDAHLDADSQMQDLDKDKDGYLTLEEFKSDHEKETYYKTRAQEIASV